jgi:hypothetical protein
MAKTQPAAMIGPLDLNLSDMVDVISTKTKDTMLGGTVYNCAVVDVYPKVLMIVGRNSEKLYKRYW